jgi:hypothetical protein
MRDIDDNEDSIAPGVIVPPEEAALLIAAFENRFRVHKEGRHPKTRTWVTFEPSNSRRMDRRAFGAVAKDAPVLLYFEGGELRRAQMDDVCHYLDDQQPWEDWDLYVFDASMTWCIALTHPQIGGRLVIVAGMFPPRATPPS